MLLLKEFETGEMGSFAVSPAVELSLE